MHQWYHLSTQRPPGTHLFSKISGNFDLAPIFLLLAAHASNPDVNNLRQNSADGPTRAKVTGKNHYLETRTSNSELSLYVAMVYI